MFAELGQGVGGLGRAIFQLHCTREVIDPPVQGSQQFGFRRGGEFWCGGRRWRCTDIGTRVIVPTGLDPDDEIRGGTTAAPAFAAKAGVESMPQGTPAPALCLGTPASTAISAASRGQRSAHAGAVRVGARAACVEREWLAVDRERTPP